MIRVVDMPMGSGKTEAAITFMNEHPEKKFLYVTPFLLECKRIVESCPGLNFAEPDQKGPSYHHKKSEHLQVLINQSRNIATTHENFCTIDNKTAMAITERKYVIIIDEAMQTFDEIGNCEKDLDILVESGYLENVSGDGGDVLLRPTEKAPEYRGRMRDLLKLAGYGQIVQTGGWAGEGRKQYGIWMMNGNLFRQDNDVYILTYLFSGSQMRSFLDYNKCGYSYLGTRRCEDGRFRFAEHGELPEYIGRLRSMVHVCDKDSINKIGKSEHALSESWTENAARDGRLRDLSNHIHTFFRRHVPQDIGSDKRLWSTYVKFKSKASGHGFKNGFLVYNSKATNAYGDRAALAYCVNIYPRPAIRTYLKHVGIEMDWDVSALSTMIQWIWRSRIRNGQEIWLYLPSRRMRELFLQWMAEAEAAYWKEVRERSESSA